MEPELEDKRVEAAQRPLRWAQLDDGAEKLAAFFREAAQRREAERASALPQAAPAVARRRRLPWKLGAIALFAVLALWGFSSLSCPGPTRAEPQEQPR